MNVLSLCLILQLGISYKIDVSLDTLKKVLLGRESVAVINQTQDTIETLYFHLYSNAFRSSRTTFMKEFYSQYLFSFSSLFFPEKYRSWTKIDSLFIEGSSSSFVDRETLMEVPLSFPFVPGDTIDIIIFFRTKIRKHIAGRVGFRGSHYDIGQWYPVLAVYRDRWFTDEFHFQGEFFNPFADYEVTIKVPKEFTVIAPGEIVKGDPGFVKKDSLSGIREVTFRARSVVDFVFSASPEFIVEDTLWNGIRVRSVYDSSKKKMFEDSLLIWTLNALQWMDSLFGPYPYPAFNAVQGVFRGGMEYPMFIHIGRKNEGTVVHEVGHNWFYGLWATDQVNEAWLDEGGTTFQTRLYLTRKKRKTEFRDPLGFLLPEKTREQESTEQVLNLIRSRESEPLLTPSYRFKNYWQVYTRGSKVYDMLKYVMGDSLFWEFIQRYYENYIFSHPRTQDFFKLSEKVYGKNLDWFYIPSVYGSSWCDYSIKKGKDWVTDNKWTTEVYISKKGEQAMPLLLFYEGKGNRDIIKIKEPVLKDTIIYLKTSFPIKKLSLNPENEILDIYMFDNFSPRQVKIIPYIPGYPKGDSYYLIEFYPYLWFNDIDGLLTGAGTKGTYLGEYANFDLMFLYGTRSKEFGYRANFNTSFPYIGRENRVYIRSFSEEGRDKFSILYILYPNKGWREPFPKWLSAGFIYRNAKDITYLDTTRWEIGKEKLFVLSFYGYPKTDLFNIDLRARGFASPAILSRVFPYQRVEGGFEIYPKRWFISSPINFKLRGYAGVIFGRAPRQALIGLSGASPWERFEDLLARTFKDRYFLKGDGNLRGYSKNLVRDLISLNLEFKLPFLGRIPFINSIDIFYDWARRIRKNETFYDFGASFEKRIHFGPRFINLSLYFPFYVSQPLLNKEKDKLAWRFAFNLRFSGF